MSREQTVIHVRRQHGDPTKDRQTTALATRANAIESIETHSPRAYYIRTYCDSNVFAIHVTFFLALGNHLSFGDYIYEKRIDRSTRMSLSFLSTTTTMFLVWASIVGIVRAYKTAAPTMEPKALHFPTQKRNEMGTALKEWCGKLKADADGVFQDEDQKPTPYQSVEDCEGAVDSLMGILSKPAELLTDKLFAPLITDDQYGVALWTGLKAKENAFKLHVTSHNEGNDLTDGNKYKCLEMTKAGRLMDYATNDAKLMFFSVVGEGDMSVDETAITFVTAMAWEALSAAFMSKATPTLRVITFQSSPMPTSYFWTTELIKMQDASKHFETEIVWLANLEHTGGKTLCYEEMEARGVTDDELLAYCEKVRLVAKSLVRRPHYTHHEHD